MELTIAQKAEKSARRRARLFPVLAIFYLTQQVSFFAQPGGDRPVDHFRIGAWVVMSCVLLFALVTGGALAQGREVRALVNDESARANRADALGTGFVVAILTGVVLYVLDTMTDVSAREAIHAIVSLGIAAALVRFGWLERRAMRDC